MKLKQINVKLLYVSWTPYLVQYDKTVNPSKPDLRTHNGTRPVVYGLLTNQINVTKNMRNPSLRVNISSQNRHSWHVGS